MSESSEATATPRNGTERPAPSSSPASGGPTSPAPLIRASSWVSASRSCSGGTTERTASSRTGPLYAMVAPITTATSRACTTVNRPSAIAAGTLSAASSRTPSATTSTRRRSQWSATAPPWMPNSSEAASCTAPNAPASVAEPVIASSSSGNAVSETWIPSVELAAPPQSNWKRRLRRSGTGAARSCGACSCAARSGSRSRTPVVVILHPIFVQVIIHAYVNDDGMVIDCASVDATAKVGPWPRNSQNARWTTSRRSKRSPTRSGWPSWAP